MPNELRIPMQATNPGQFFACCGLFDLAWQHGDRGYAWFEPRRENFATFCLQSARTLEELLDHLRTAGISPWGEFSDAKLAPMRLGNLKLDWWLDIYGEKAENRLKNWSGQSTTRKLLTDLQAALDSGVEAEDLFQAKAPLKAKFGVDPRSAWTAQNVGFSPDEHSGAAVYPAVELLAAIGLQSFRPPEFCYSLWLDPLPRDVARFAAFEPWKGLRCAVYEFRLADRGSCGYFEEAKKETNND